MRFSACAISYVGKYRQDNEDNYLLAGECVNAETYKKTKTKEKGNIICSVCDGMGGESNGDIASQAAVESLRYNQSVISDNGFDNESIADVILQANSDVCSAKNGAKKTMGTTVAMFCGYGDRFAVANVGDSRVYRFGDEGLTLLSHDHTEAQMLINAGIEVGADDSRSHILTQYLGIEMQDMIIEPYIANGMLRAKDKFLLCSDGLYDFVSESDIAQCMASTNNVEKIADSLINLAKNNNGRDNVTVIVVKVK